MNQLQLTTTLNKPLTMTSKHIADLTGKLHKNVIRDIRAMICELHNINDDGSDLSHQLKQCVTGLELDERNYISLIELNEELTLTLTTGYSVIQRHKIIKQWQVMREALEAIRYRKHDTLAQINAMAIISQFLTPEDRKTGVNYIIANGVVNKLVSDLFGFPKMIKKCDMNIAMLERRACILDDYVKLFEFGISNHNIKQSLYDKYFNRNLVA